MEDSDIETMAIGIVNAHRTAGKVDVLKELIRDRRGDVIAYLMGEVDRYSMIKCMNTAEPVMIYDLKEDALRVLNRIEEIIKDTVTA